MKMRNARKLVEERTAGSDPGIRSSSGGPISLGPCLMTLILSSFADPHKFLADPNADPDPACHFDADVDSDLDPTVPFTLMRSGSGSVT